MVLATKGQVEEEQQQQFTDRYLFSMLARFLRPYWKQLLITFIMLLAVTIVSLMPPYLIQRAVDGPIANNDFGGLIPYAVLYFLAIPTIFALRFGYIYILQTAGQSALMDLRQTLFEHIMRQDMRFFNKTPVGQIVARLSSDIESLTELLSTSIVIVISNMITLVGIVLVMFALNWRLALVSLVVMPILVMMSAYFRMKIRKASRNYHKTVADYLAYINEQFNGMLMVQLFGRQDLSRQEFQAINQKYLDIRIGLRDWYTYFASALQLMTAIGLAVVLFGGGSGVVAEWATLGMLISFIQYSQNMYRPILELSDQFAQLQTALSAGERIARMLRVESEIAEPENPATFDHIETAITFEEVEFYYEEDAPVIRHVDTHIPAGQFVALVGATGAGKTTLAGLLARFYDVRAGAVKIGGVDVRDMRVSDLRQHVMVVPQAPYCFNGTIADNLKLFNERVTHAQMVQAARTACAAPFIEALPGGYDFELLPGAANLSQGQRQLLALARALIHNPDSILVLDEATSNIDTETEAYIQEGLRQVLKGRTSVVIAHRLSTVREADRILVMKQGAIIEDGSHDELLAQGGMYADLVRRQFAEQF